MSGAWAVYIMVRATGVLSYSAKGKALPCACRKISLFESCSTRYLPSNHHHLVRSFPQRNSPPRLVGRLVGWCAVGLVRSAYSIVAVVVNPGRAWWSYLDPAPVEHNKFEPGPEFWDDR